MGDQIKRGNRAEGEIGPITLVGLYPNCFQKIPITQYLLMRGTGLPRLILWRKTAFDFVTQGGTNIFIRTFYGLYKQGVVLFTLLKVCLRVGQREKDI